ncbi:restriction endonuclease subunit S [Methanosarcina sp.]|jgi:type I restriction enzyme S subunit|uniref:restriction endonuclease subunit S n=1 Tax=Methanosarcina sp. TaxID=2213 RepID=UPI002BDBBB1F|nr:restriction endonuclease subunit S [Methanosarcina sp.]HOW15869.1 restriction endonuclease subunit S [Methanosarcina sp.]
MNQDVFFKNFELLADAPNGVQKLRELILQLAVMGKLVPQDPNDDPASVLLEKIKAEKKKLIKEGKSKGSKLISSKDADQIPYEIPSNWEWTTLSECGLINPRNDISDEKEVSFIPMTCISEKYGQKVEMEIRKWEEIKKGFTHFAENDVVLAKITPCFQNGKSAVMKGLKNGFGAGTTELHVFRPLKELIIPNFVLIYIKSPDFIYGGVPKMTGSAGQKRVPKDYFSENPFPLPPLAEQKRIVSKVDELMALCDKLEARHQKKQEIQSKLNSAALERMLSAENKEEFEQYWQRICENFDLLYDNPENVEKLRQAILQLAVQGKLVPQNPEDEPASVLIEKIETEKKRCIISKEIQDDKKLSTIMKENPPWIIPPSWKWIRLQEIFEITRGGSPRPAGDPQYFGGNIPWITVREITKDSEKYLTITTDFLTELGSKRSRYIYPSDLLLTNSGATLGVPKISQIKGCINDGVARLNCFHDLISKDYAYYYLFQQTRAFREVNQGMGQPNLNTSILAGWFFPLPPLNEQKRIVEKVEQFMGLCDELEAKLRKSREDSEKLMETVVRGLLEGAATEI